MGSESDVRQWGPSPAGRVRLEIRWCFGVKEPRQTGRETDGQTDRQTQTETDRQTDRQTDNRQTTDRQTEAETERKTRRTETEDSFLMGSESDVRQWGPSPAGRVRLEIRWCFGVKEPRQTGRETDGQTDRQTQTETDRQTDRQTDTEKPGRDR